MLVLFFLLLILLLLILIIEAIDQLVFLLILVLLLLVFLWLALGVLLIVDIWHIFKSAVFDLFDDPEDGKREVYQKEEEEAELEEKRGYVEGFGKGGELGEVVEIRDAFVGCKEETLECEVNHFL